MPLPQLDIDTWEMADSGQIEPSEEFVLASLFVKRPDLTGIGRSDSLANPFLSTITQPSTRAVAPIAPSGRSVPFTAFSATRSFHLSRLGLRLAA